MAIRVLIAHGNTQRLKDAVTGLHGAGFDVTATPDGGDAFARFFEDQPDLVICSEQLPGLSGSSIARMVKSQSKNTPVVLLIEGLKPADPVFEGVAVLRDPLSLELLQEAVPEINFSISQEIVHEEDVDFTSASPAKVFVHAVLKRYQRDNPVLAVLNDAGITRMANMAQHRSSTDKEVIIRQGDPGDGFYLVVEGQVRVLLAEKDNKEVARINAGGFFGEMAMLSQQKRSASIETVGQTTLLWFDKESFMPILNDYPQVREVLSGVALRRSEENLWRVLFDDDEVQRSIANLDPDAQQAADRAIDELEIAVETQASPVPSILGRTPVPAQRWTFLHGLLGGLPAGAVVGAVAMMMVSPQPASLATASPPTVQKVVAKPIAIEKAEPIPTPTGTSATTTTTTTTTTPTTPAAAATGPSVVAAVVTPVPSAPVVAEKLVEPKPTVKANSEGASAIFDAWKAANYKQVIQLAAAQDAATLDEMTIFYLADAQRQVGQVDKALAGYLAFRTRYPQSSKADDAAFWAADLLSSKGKKDDAMKLYQLVADDPASNFRNSATKRLAK